VPTTTDSFREQELPLVAAAAGLHTTSRSGPATSKHHQPLIEHQQKVVIVTKGNEDE